MQVKECLLSRYTDYWNPFHTSHAVVPTTSPETDAPTTPAPTPPIIVHGMLTFDDLECESSEIHDIVDDTIQGTEKEQYLCECVVCVCGVCVCVCVFVCVCVIIDVHGMRVG